MLLLLLASVSLLLTTSSAESLDISKLFVSLTIKENTNNGVWVLNASASNVNYTLEQFSNDQMWKKFFIAGNAELRQNYIFDYENDPISGFFTITANYGQTKETAKIRITIDDVNEHTPVFTDLPSTVTVSEAIGVNTTIFTISGEDDDGSDVFNFITFFIIDGNANDKFYLSYVNQKSVSVNVRSRLDHDTGPGVYNLTINATDARAGINPIGLWNVSYLVIETTDVDDLPASFTKEVYGPINIAENLAPGSFITQVTAVDKDKTVKDEVLYSIVQVTNPGGVFTINETTGNITLVGSLDRQTQSFYALLVRANSTYHDPVHAQVLILLDDANVHKPNFTSDTYHGQVAENAEPGTLVLVVQATDSDQGNNAEVSYSLVGEHDDKFIITTVNSLGYIYVNSSLDYDVKNYYNFSVVATESLTSEKYNDTATVVMNITEILSNENNPKFSQATYEANVTEGMSPGRVVQVNAVDSDQGQYASITYSIVHDEYDMFAIDNKSGWINTTNLLDRENRDSYTLVVRASDGDTNARHTDVLVVVTVLDINDNTPTFSANSYSGSVVENSNLGNTILAVEAKDLDEGANAAFNFTVFGGNETFAVVSDGNRGYVIVNGSLDYELHKEYTFLVIAEETATSEKNQANVTVTVSLIDVNDNSPVFTSVSGYSVSLAEDSPNGTTVLNVSATDQDSGTFAQIVYTLYTLSVPFTINPTTGEITTAGNLDRETKSSYSLTIKAQDGGQPSLFSYAQVIINITDTNDNPPIFSPSTYSAEIEENMKIGSRILTVTATDADEGPNSYLRYYIQDSNGLFGVGSDGVVDVNGTLDYESNVTFTFVVFAEESSTTENWKANCTVTIRLKDVNEFDPEFTLSSYYGYVKENSASGSLVVTVQATDQDGVLHVITYEIVSGNEKGNFSIDQNSGAIKTTGPIDRETTEQFILKIRASDNGTPNRTTETFVVIEIFDTNDHSPIFTQSSYNTSVPESLPVGTTILTVKAIDLDVNSTNSDIRYFISGSDSKFDVTTSGHVFVNGTLNFENKSTYSFMIFAEETGTVAKQQHNASIVITVTDVNEYDPVFTQSGFYGNASENAANGTAVVKIAALDRDGYYNVIKYSISHGNDENKFSINGSSGVVFTAGSLDRETKSEYILTVKAEDNGTPARTSEVTVVINVLDVNDNGPMFNQPTYNTTIFENIEPGTTLLTVKAEDQDEGENAQFDYYIVGAGQFEVSSGGVIVTKAMLDYETSTAHTFLVIANETNSSGSEKANATVTIFVRDVNEFNPVFAQLRYIANVSENSAVGTPLIQVNASDKDGFYNKLTYSIVSGNDDNKFTINASTGLISTNATLDRETVAQFILNVRSDDNGISPARTAEVVVIVNVVDLNDHSPLFLQRHYNVSVFENVAVSTTVLTVEATDNDKGANALIQYFIVGGDGAFRVTENGDIIVNASLNYEHETKYEFQVIAKESQAASSLNDSTNVTIFVQDVNEYNPVFNKLSYIATVNGTNQQGTPVIQVTATDGDGLYKMITYSIVYGNDAGIFEINSTTGWITTKTVLDSGTRNQYILTVKAEDNGVFPRNAEVLVVININETNKNATFLVQDIYNVTVLENALVGSTVVKLDVRDGSKDETSVYSFNIDGGNGDFEVSSLGEVQVKNALDYETKSLYSFKVTVTEIQPASGLAANATVNVKVLDVNEFNPKFSQDSYVGNVSEGAGVGTFIIQVSASDGDGFYNISSYTIIHGDKQNNFTINTTSGEIKTATPLDREVKDQFILTVRAQDNGPSGRTAEVVVIVDILDISDHPPLFLMSNYSGMIFENAPVGSTVLTVKTSDLDMDTKSSLTYAVVGGDGKFGVTSAGVIYVNGSLDYETKTVYTFLVTAEEPSPFSHHKDNVSVSVKLMDINEFNPQFNQSVYSASVNEKDVIGTSVVTVFASDKDGDFNLVTYSIVSGNNHGNFSINNDTGTITIVKPLDRESHDQVILTVRGEDNGVQPRTSEVTVIIGITDSNDNGPVFQMPYYNASISEEAATGTTVLAVLALDQDATQNSLSYHIDSENTFKMETHYGLGFVVVNKELDYEMKKSYSFMVDAIEKTTEKRNTSVQVNITVLDANDNRPIFGNSSYTGAVMEGMAIATPVLTVSANDADSEAFRPIYFEIVEGDPFGNFSINNMTGLLATATVLDREIQQIFPLIIEARDSGSPALTETVAVTISIVDYNDASPRFIGLPYTADVQENSLVDTNVLTIQALDMDKSENGEFSYSLVGDNGFFSITQKGNIGHIKVAVKLLDYEKNQTFKFYVVAKETKSSEKKESNASVVVTLIDVNDNSPVFQKSLYEESVSESPSFPNYVGTVSAVDKDSGAFGTITFFIIHGNENGNFTINNRSGLVETATLLNRESQDRYVLTIEARDGGSPPRTAVTIMVIKVTDQNEQPPIFHDTPYKATIIENESYTKYVVLKVSASDPDKMEIEYTLQPSSEFTIEQTTGVIKVTGSFDRELKSVYNLTVTAIDKGGLNVSEQVLIRVIDTNDNSPQFLNTPYKTSIPDNTTVGISIMTVTATDADEAHNAEIIFSLIGGGGRFAINQSTGEITVAGKLDSQSKATYELQVVATDRGIPQARVNFTTVVVNLTDYSNGAPKFESVAYVGVINETLINGTFVLNVKANDPDVGILGQITYSITGGNTYNAFKIDSTGAILSTIALDYENDTQKTFDLTITAADRDGLKDTTQIRITILDVNDNAPTIVNIPSPAEVNISDQVPAGTLLYVLQGQDPDSGENGEFEFFGIAVPDNLTVDQTTGVIKAKTVLQNSASASISLTVFVSDKGTPSKPSSNYAILFHIATSPSSTPFLLPSLTEVTVFENASIGDDISVINSSLSADNFSIIFQLPNGGHFKIDNLGSLSLAQQLDRETVDGYSLLVKAVKGGTQALGYVSITVGDVNDDNPEFLFDVYKGQIDENVAVGRAVLAVKAVDKDQGNTISYSITSGNSEGVFNISADGEVRIAYPPDYEKEKFFNLTVVASDGVNTDTAFVEITIVDLNDNSPIFLNSSYSSTVPEDTPGGTSILKVFSVDDDGDIIIYSISGTDGKFTIDSISGVITTTAQRLDYEKQTTYSLNVTATDTGGLQTSVMVVLNITDTNDNEPIFEKASYNVTIADGYLGWLPVIVKATDKDSGQNGNVTYSFTTTSSLFSINPLTGTINSTVAIDRDAVGVSSDASCRGVFVLFIQAEDGGSPPLTDSTTVTVYVTDANDNKPMFSKSSYEVTISVADTGDVVLLKASDSDCGVNAAIQYSYTSDNGSSLFEVNATIGNVTIKKALNGSQGVYFLNVSATNEQGSPKLQSSVTVKITVIENKNYAPVFEKSEYNFNVSEGAEIGFILGSVSAKDVNQGKNGVFIYSIQNPGYAIPFDIDPEKGSIILVRELNREERVNYTLVVVAKDFGEPSLTHTTTVVITVDDVNDEVPKFQEDTLSFSTPENLTLGSYVASVNAVDGDVEKHGEPIYVIYSGNEEGYFRIDNSTGSIYLMKELDRELINVFVLFIRAYNYGSNVSRRRRDAEPSYSEVKVIINVTDINDNYPEFVQTDYVAGFKDSSEPGTKVATVLAFDKDEGLNSQIVYKIASGNGAGAFQIDPNTGLITTTAAVSQLTGSIITLTVTAQDSSPNGQQKMAQKSAAVKIYKLDLNPLFVNISSSTDRETIINLLKNITGSDSDIIIESITSNGLLSNVKYYVVKNGDFLTQSQMANLTIKFCEENEDICKNFGINLAEQNSGSTSALLGENDISILEAMLLTLGVIVGVGGLLGILLLCCFRRRKRYMPVYEPSAFILPSKAVSFDEKPHYFRPDPRSQESQEVEIRIDEEVTSVDSADEAPESTSSNDSANTEAIAKVNAYMNHALMNDDSDSDSSEDTQPGMHLQTRVDGDSLRGSTEPLVTTYDITSI